MAEYPENPGSQGSPNPQYGAPAPPPFQPVSTQYQPVAAAATFQPAAPPVRSGGSSAVKIILIIVGILVLLFMLVVGVIGYIGWRVARNIHVDNKTGETTITTPGGTFSANSADNFTAAELGTDIYPGAQPATGGMRMKIATSSVIAANYTTPDSKDQVIAFYKGKLGSDVTLMDFGSNAILQLRKGDQEEVKVTITSEAAGKTKFQITHSVVAKTQ